MAWPTDGWFTLAIAIEGRSTESRVFSIWAAPGTDVTPSDLVFDKGAYTAPGGYFSLDLLKPIRAHLSMPTCYFDKVAFYSGYGEGVIPEPSTLALLGVGGLGLVVLAFRRRRRK